MTIHRETLTVLAADYPEKIVVLIAAAASEASKIVHE
jgi:hypothetical protein